MLFQLFHYKRTPAAHLSGMFRSMPAQTIKSSTAPSTQQPTVHPVPGTSSELFSQPVAFHLQLEKRDSASVSEGSEW